MLASGIQLRKDIARMVRPREKITVVESASRYVKVRTPNGSVANWEAKLTPYMVQPMNLLTSRIHEAIVYVGSAQGGKTQGLVLGCSAHPIIVEPSDFMIMQTSRETARDFDMQSVKRMFRNSPQLKKEIAKGSKSDNTFDKVFRSGNILFQAWPTINKLSGKPLKFVFLTDFDRFPKNIDGEGSAFSLAMKRTATFLSRGMTVAESSPGYDITDPNYKPKNKHESPPCGGILSLFNMGDMRRYYVKCPNCHEYYMPPCDERGLDFAHNRDIFEITLTDITRKVSFICTSNGCLIDPINKVEMNRTALWVPQGCHIEKGEVIGEPVKSKIASFWQPGIFAAYSNIESMVQKYLNACREFDLTGAEENLKTCINVDFGAPYLPRRMVSDKNADDYQQRAENLPQRRIPDGVLFIIAAVDVQSWGWVVQVTGFGVNSERWVIDRYNIEVSKRKDRGELLKASPAAYVEDWDLITEKVIGSSYPLADNSGRFMKVLLTVCDSGGQKGVTSRAYDYWRKLRKLRLNNAFALIKGERPKATANRPLVRRSFPENTDRSKRTANARGEIPLFILNTTKLKDAISNDLARTKVGQGFIHFPDWLKPSFYDELIAETRGIDGWENIGNHRNESFDLLGYADAGIRIKLIMTHGVILDWDKPPIWAREWDDNSLIKQGNETEQQATSLDETDTLISDLFS